MPPKFFKKKGTYIKKEVKKESEETNAKYLVIVESPSKCKKIEDFLGDQYKCIASYGHLRHIGGLKSINTKGHFDITFSTIKEKEQQIESIKKTISMFDPSNIFLATDDDREGESIAWHICKLFDLPIDTTPRIIFHEITKTAILHAISNPTRINMNIVHAQHARQVLDIIVGFKVSPFLWKYIYSSKDASLSAGRCQTPALRLVYDKQQNSSATPEIEVKYKTTASFFESNIVFQLNRDFREPKEVIEFLELSKTHKHILSIENQKDITCSPPIPFSTSKLLQTASNILHISPKQTMSLCQKLYQDGHITYMRTDSTKYSKDFLEKASNYISGKWKPAYVGNIDSLVNKDANDPHEAIRVTHIEVSEIVNKDKDNVAASLYKLIWRNTVESCMTPATYKCKLVKITAPNELLYSYSLEIPIHLGWRTISNKVDSNINTTTNLQSQTSSELFYIESIEKSGEPVKYNKIEAIVTGTPIKQYYYTEASLIQELEKNGIGRPSTFSLLVDTIQDRGYVKKMDIQGEKRICKEFLLMDHVLETNERERVFGNEKGKLVIQPIGIVTIEFLIKYFNPLFSYDYTKLLEEKLDEIGSQTTSIEWYEICKSCNKQIKECITPITRIEKQSYKITDGYELVFQQFGPVLRHKNENGEMEYKSIKKDLRLDLEKIKAGGYSLDDLIEIKTEYLGKYENEDVLLKSGKYGLYIEYGENRKTIYNTKDSKHEITLEDVIPFITKEKDEEKDGSQRTNILRTIDENTSIRKGKYGSYVYYKTREMKKPQFFKTNSFRKGLLVCELSELKDWLKNTYNIHHE
jgi:DNA topoisomerase-1